MCAIAVAAVPAIAATAAWIHHWPIPHFAVVKDGVL